MKKVPLIDSGPMAITVDYSPLTWSDSDQDKQMVREKATKRLKDAIPAECLGCNMLRQDESTNMDHLSGTHRLRVKFVCAATGCRYGTKGINGLKIDKVFFDEATNLTSRDTWIREYQTEFGLSKLKVEKVPRDVPKTRPSQIW